MLLKQIIGQLDAELDRLRSLRKIVAGLARTSPAVQRAMASSVDTLQAVAAVREVQPAVAAAAEPVRRVRAVRVAAPVRRARRLPEPEQTALAHAIPTGPVVVMPEALKRERAARQAAPPAAEAKVPELNAESLTRDLAARWLSGAKPLSA